jgi:hypothetical protein
MAKCVQRSNGDVLVFWPCEQQPPCIEGWLKRRRGLVAAWHKVFVKIDGHQHKLRLYKRQTDTTPKTSVPLKYPSTQPPFPLCTPRFAPLPLTCSLALFAHAHAPPHTHTHEHAHAPANTGKS